VFVLVVLFFFFSSRRRHTRFSRDWSSDVCSSDLDGGRIRSKCLRLNILEPLDDFNFVSKIDLILVDNIDTEYMSRQSLEQLLRLQDYIEPFCNLIFYNISKKNAQLPKIFKDILELSNNIQFK